jgi:hypothetical protein
MKKGCGVYSHLSAQSLIASQQLPDGTGKADISDACNIFEYAPFLQPSTPAGGKPRWSSLAPRQPWFFYSDHYAPLREQERRSS